MADKEQGRQVDIGLSTRWHLDMGNSRSQSLVLMSVLLLFFSFPLVVWIHNSQYMRFVADDFCYAVSARTNGYIYNVLVQYQDWGGRYSATLVYGLLTQIGYSSIWVVVLASLVAWFLALVWVFYQLAVLSRMHSPLSVAISVGIITLFCVFSAVPSMPQSLYWIGSLSNYVFPMIGFTLWIGGIVAVYRRSLSKPTTTFAIILNVIISLCLGGFAETYVVFQTMAFGAALFLLTTLSSDNRKHNLVLFLTTGLIGSLVALVVQSIAPGNAARLAVLPHDLPVYERVVKSLAFIPFGYSQLAAFSLTSVFVLVFLVVNINLPSQPWPISQHIVRSFALTGAVALVLIWAVKFPNFYAASYFPPYRALLVPTTVVVIMMVTWGMLAPMCLPHMSFASRRVWKAIFLFLGLAALSVPVYDGLTSLDRTVTFRTFAEAWDRSQNTILSERASGNTNIITPVIPVDMYSVLDLNTVASDPDASYYWVNECMAAYYQVDTILASEVR